MIDLVKMKFPVWFSQLHILRLCFRAHFSHRKDKNNDYTKHNSKIQEKLTLVDRPFSFFLRCAIEFSHKTVIEIGTYNGRRIINLKRILPNIDAYGLDILKNFKHDFESHGVKFSYFTLDFFNRKFENPLVICNGTLCCLSPAEFREFINSMKKNRFALAFSEPVPIFRHKNHIRRSFFSYYHPYHYLLPKYGFQLAEEDHFEATLKATSLPVSDDFYYNYAFSKK